MGGEGGVVTPRPVRHHVLTSCHSVDISSLQATIAADETKKWRAKEKPVRSCSTRSRVCVCELWVGKPVSSNLSAAADRVARYRALSAELTGLTEPYVSFLVWTPCAWRAPVDLELACMLHVQVGEVTMCVTSLEADGWRLCVRIAARVRKSPCGWVCWTATAMRLRTQGGALSTQTKNGMGWGSTWVTMPSRNAQWQQQAGSWTLNLGHPPWLTASAVEPAVCWLTGAAPRTACKRGRSPRCLDWAPEVHRCSPHAVVSHTCSTARCGRFPAATLTAS